MSGARSSILVCLAFLGALQMSCEGGGLLALGSFEKSFSIPLDPVEVPSIAMEELLDERAIRALLTALGYDLRALERASADFSSPNSVARAAARIGAPLERHDAELRALLEGAAERYAAATLSRPEAGLRITIDFSSLREAPIDYGDLEGSLDTLRGELRVIIRIEQELASLDALLADEAELRSLLRSGLLESIRVEEIGVRTLTASEKRRHEEGANLGTELRNELLIEGCVEPSQPMMEGMRALRIELRSLRQSTAPLRFADIKLEEERSFCALHVDAASPELIELFTPGEQLILRVEVEARLPELPLDLGGFLWIRGGTGALGVSNL